MTSSAQPVVVLLRGGPLDGQEHAIANDADHLDVTMADDTRHRYNRAEAQLGSNLVTYFDWAGRC